MLSAQGRATRLFLSFWAIVLLTSMCPGASAQAAIQWYSSVEEASTRAIPVNQPIMIDFWADWCGACKVMEREVYSTPDFLEATKKFLPVKIDFDKKAAVARKYNVKNLPTIMFTDSYGNELFRYQGYASANALLDLANALTGNVTEFNRLSRILATDKNNFQALESMGKGLRAAGLFRTSSDYYAKAARRPEAKADPQVREMILHEMGLNFLELQDSKLAAESFEKCLKQFPNSPKKAVWTLDLGQAYALGEKKEKARQLLQTFIQDHPSSPESEQARKILNSL